MIQQRVAFDCYRCKRCSLKDLEFLLYLISEKTKMRIMKKPQSVKAKDGVSIQAIWEASTIAIHEWDEPKFVSVDIYTCKKVDLNEVFECLKEILEPEVIEIWTPVRIAKIDLK